MPAAGRYYSGLEALAQGEVDLIDDDIRVIACKAEYVADLTADGYYVGANPDIPNGWLADASGNLLEYDDVYYSSGSYADINGDADTTGAGNPIAVSGVVGYGAASLATKDVTGGKFNAADPLFVALPASNTITQFVVTKFEEFYVNVSYVAYHHVPLALITKDSSDVDISFATGGGLDLLVRWENVAPYIFEV